MLRAPGAVSDLDLVVVACGSPWRWFRVHRVCEVRVSIHEVFGTRDMRGCPLSERCHTRVAKG